MERELNDLTNGEAVRERQAAVIRGMLSGAGDLGDVLRGAGVSEDEFAEWLAEGSFTDLAAELSEEYARAMTPFVYSSLISTARGGNVPAIKLFLEFLRKNQQKTLETLPTEPDPEVASLRESLFGGGV